MDNKSVFLKIIFWGAVVVGIRILLFVAPVMMSKIMP